MPCYLLKFNLALNSILPFLRLSTGFLLGIFETFLCLMLAPPVRTVLLPEAHQLLMPLVETVI